MRGHVFKRGSKWVAVFDEGRQNGKRKQRWLSGFPSKREAENALREALSRVERGDYLRPSRETVGEFLARWLDAIQVRVRPSTWDSYRRNIDDHVNPRVGAVPLQRLSASRLNALYADLLASGRKNGRGGLSARSVRYVHAILHSALADAVRWGDVPRNVADLADPPSPKRGDMATWTAGEVGEFLNYLADDPLAGAFVVLATTGMRRGEVLGLRWRDVDLENGTATIQQAVTAVAYEVHVGPPKAGRGRTVALSPGAISALREQRRRQAEERLAASDYENADLVFARPDGSPVHPDRLRKVFDAKVVSAGLRRIRLHDLRHTWATLALAAGVHPKIVSEQLGHSNVVVTLGTYSHVLPNLAREEALRVAGLIEG